MKLSQELLNNLIEITSNSAIACFPFIGKNEKILADKAATDVMRYQLNKLDIKGRVEIKLAFFINVNLFITQKKFPHFIGTNT